MYHFLSQQGVDEDHETLQWETPSQMALSCGTAHLSQYDVQLIAESLLFTPLHLAVAMADFSVDNLTSILEREYANVDAIDKLGATALHWASMQGNAEAITLLLRWKANVNLPDLGGSPALHGACASGSVQSVELLLAAGANVNTPCKRGRTALFWLDNSGEAIINLIVQRCANLNSLNYRGETALHQAAQRDDRHSIISSLIEAGANFNVQDANGYTPTLAAISQSRQRSVDVLVASAKETDVSVTHFLALALVRHP